MSLNQKHKQTHQSFLLTFFDNKLEKQVKEMNGFVLVKYHDNSTNRWGIQLYSRESYDKYLKWVKQAETKANQPQVLFPESQTSGSLDVEGNKNKTPMSGVSDEGSERPPYPWEDNLK